MVRVSVDNGHGKEIGSKDKNARLGPTSRDRSIIDFSVVHLYLFGTEHAVILYTMNEDAVTNAGTNGHEK